MRIATQADRPVLNDLWQQAFGDGPEFSNFVFDKFAGFDHTYVEEQGGQLVASACAVPVTLGALRGFYLYGLNTRGELRGRGIMRTLLQTLEQQLAAGGHVLQQRLQLPTETFPTLAPGFPERQFTADSNPFVINRKISGYFLRLSSAGGITNTAGGSGSVAATFVLPVE